MAISRNSCHLTSSPVELSKTKPVSPSWHEIKQYPFDSLTLMESTTILYTKLCLKNQYRYAHQIPPEPFSSRSINLLFSTNIFSQTNSTRFGVTSFFNSNNKPTNQTNEMDFIPFYVLFPSIPYGPPSMDRTYAMMDAVRRRDVTIKRDNRFYYQPTGTWMRVFVPPYRTDEREVMGYAYEDLITELGNGNYYPLTRPALHYR